MATWSISVSRPTSHQSSPRAWRWNSVILSSPMRVALLRVRDAEARRSGARQRTASLPSASLLVDGAGRLADLGEVVGGRHDRLDAALVDEAVHVPRLLVVGEVRRDDPLQLHPEVAVVVLEHEARRRRAGDDRAAALGDEHRRAERRPARVLEHDARVLADEAAHLLAEPAPLALVLGVLVLPELVALGGAVDDVLAAHRLEQLHPLGARHDADRRAAAVEHELDGVGADAAGGAPHEHRVALLHLGGVAADEHPVAGGGAQPVDGALLPGEVLGLRHELVGLHDRRGRPGRRSSTRSPRCAGWRRASSRRAADGSWSSR